MRPRGTNKSRWLARRLRTYLQALRSDCPTSGGLPVRVRWSDVPYDGKNSLGWTNLRRDRRGRPSHYVIVIRRRGWRDENYPGSRRPTFVELRDTLIHEWAHAMSWNEHDRRYKKARWGSEDPMHPDHGSTWGIMFSKAYRATISE